MARTDLTSKGVVVNKGGSDTVQIKVPVTFDTGLTLTTEVLTVNSGAFTVTNGQTFFTRVSGSGTSGQLSVGAAANIAVADRVNLILSSAAAEGCRNAIMLFSTGAQSATDQRVGAGSVANGAGGAEGVMQAPPANAIYLYTDGVNLYFRNSGGIAKVLATGSTGIPI